MLRWSAPVLVVQAMSTVLFAVSPLIESQYLHSPSATALLGDAAARLYTDLPNNVIDPAKSGGVLFVNGNVASSNLIR